MILQVLKMFKDMPEGLYKQLYRKKVFIAGAGGLGSNSAMLLIRAGISNFIIIDYDTIELRNLNRQFYFHHQTGQKKVESLKTNLLAIQPEAKIEIINRKMTAENMSSLIPDDIDLLLECFDNPQSKAELVQYMLIHKKEIPVVAVSGIGGKESLELIKSKKGPGNLYLVGDGVNGVENGLGTLSSRVMCAAAHQAHIAINILINI
jgi:sulfur carrier protein ThiS adenylyltransferase